MDQRQKQGVMGTAVNGFRAAGGSVPPIARMALMGSAFSLSFNMNDPFQLPIPGMEQPLQFGPTGDLVNPLTFNPSGMYDPSIAVFDPAAHLLTDVALGWQILGYLAMADLALTGLSFIFGGGNLKNVKFMPMTRGIIKTVAGIDPLNPKKNIGADATKGLDADTGAQNGAEKTAAALGKTTGLLASVIGAGLGVAILPSLLQGVGFMSMYTGLPLMMLGGSIGAFALPLVLSLALGLAKGNNKIKKLGFAATGVAAYGLAAMETGASNFLPGAEMMAGNETIAGLSSTFTEAAMGFSSQIGNAIGGMGMHMAESGAFAGTQAGSALAGGSQWLMQAMADPTGALITTAVAAFIVYKAAKAAYNVVKSDKKKKGPAPKGTEAAA